MYVYRSVRASSCVWRKNATSTNKSAASKISRVSDELNAAGTSGDRNAGIACLCTRTSATIFSGIGTNSVRGVANMLKMKKSRMSAQYERASIITRNNSPMSPPRVYRLPIFPAGALGGRERQRQAMPPAAPRRQAMLDAARKAGYWLHQVEQSGKKTMTQRANSPPAGARGPDCG